MARRSGRAIEKIEADARAVELRRAKLTYTQIANELGITLSAAYNAVQRGLKDMFYEAAEDVRQFELDDLDALDRRMRRILASHHITVSQGRVVLDPRTGEPVPDLTPIFHAVEKILKIKERRAKYLGLDTPVKVTAEVRSVDVLDAEIQRLMEEIATRHEGTPSRPPAS